jgi:transcriptional regulator with XRE-family HTH domain
MLALPHGNQWERAMSMFDGLTGNFEEIAARFGLPADQVQQMLSGIASGNFDMAAMMKAAEQYGVTPDKMQEMMSQFGGADMLSKMGEMFGQAGDDNPLARLTKGLFK